MKLDKPPFNDIRVRKAVHLAIDRDGLVKTVTFGAGAINPPGGLALSSGAIPLEELRKLPGWRQPKDEDIAEAKRLLAEAGYPNGFKTTIITARDRTTAVPVLEATAPMLKAIGIDAEVGLLERAVFLTRQRDGDYDAQMDLIHSDPPTERLLTYYHSKGNLNKAPINDPELDKLIDAIDSELDPKKADEILLRIQRMVLDKHYTIPTVELPSFAFWQAWLNNYNLSFSAQPYIPQWDNLWMDPEKGYPSDRTLER
jgi:peptide/nickel transport system substrate-binding protein